MKSMTTYMPNSSTLRELREAIDEIVMLEGENAAISHIDYERKMQHPGLYAVKCHITLESDE